MPSRVCNSRSGQAGTAARVAGSQIALALSNYLILAIAARHVDAAGLAALSSYYLLLNTVGRGIFAAVELETTRAVALAVATGTSVRRARADALRNTGHLLAGAIVLLIVSAPLIAPVVGSGFASIGLLAVGAMAMAASYLLRGPLAGTRRYGTYSATFWVEAGAGIGAAAVLAWAGVTSPLAWIAVFALVPLVAAATLGRTVLRVSDTDTDSAEVDGEDCPATRSTRAELLYSAALLLAGQGVWNLAPVLVTARMVDAPAVAAGFVTVAIILRAPVLFFPAVQAVLLPAITEMTSADDDVRLRRTTRSLLMLLAGGGAVWIALSVTVVAPLATAVFAATTTPPRWVLLVLALSTVIGAAAQIAQTHLVVLRRQRHVALAWAAALVLLVVIGLLVAPPLTGATLGQLAAAVLVLVLLTVARHQSTTGSRT